MNAYSSAVRRPPFRVDGRIVARRAVLLGKAYAPGQEIPSSALDARQLAVLWNQLLVDTLPPVQPQRPQQHHNQRR